VRKRSGKVKGRKENGKEKGDERDSNGSSWCDFGKIVSWR